MSAQDCEQLTLFPADSPASPFPWLESKREKKMIVTSGRRCSELSESCARAALSVRTYLESSRLPPGKWSRIWSVQAITSSCLILKLRLSELGTDDQGYSSPASQMWPTPTVVGCTIASEKRINLLAAGKTTFTSNQGVHGGSSNLREHVLARGSHIPLNPADLPKGMRPKDYMCICFAMIDVADLVVFLPDAKDSAGARLEKAYCEYVGKEMEFWSD